MQTVDYVTLVATLAELRARWLPARVEQFYQRDRQTLTMALRTLTGRDWLTLAWHPQAARICIEDPPPRTPDTFTFSDQLRHQLNGLALIDIQLLAQWERVVDFQFAGRPGEAPRWHLYVEIIGKYSNVILTNADNEIVTVAHQVNAKQSRIRTVKTGDSYIAPPALLGDAPKLSESLAVWQEKLTLVPGKLQRQLVQCYRGVSPVLARELATAATVDPNVLTTHLTTTNWEALYQAWRRWLQQLENEDFQPSWTAQGYSVLGWSAIASVESVQKLLKNYYYRELGQQTFSQRHHYLSQKMATCRQKAQQKVDDFRHRLGQSAQADNYRLQADLLMAYPLDWRPGLQILTLPDFETQQPVSIALAPDKTGIQNAQRLYKRHQKLKRSRQAIEPLLAEATAEVAYLDSVNLALADLHAENFATDEATLQEIQAELIEQGYVPAERQLRDRKSAETSKPWQYQSPNGIGIWIGRNNRQNEQLTFRLATSYDGWLHAQEIPGSHVLLRLEPGVVPEPEDLQFAADLAAFYSRARLSQQVPVVYTAASKVVKPKGSQPGLAIYQPEQVLWGTPERVRAYIEQP
ncbi:MAG: NFACT RNA binding domain-containing protein [Cyanobacteria bacterium P01_H01_bin.15]